jgi:cellulose biosynthesis protein BcsQ
MKNDFAKRLKIAFENKTYKQISILLGITDAAVSNYFNGKLPPTDKLLQISEITGCNLHWLLIGDGEQYLTGLVQKPKTLLFQGCKGGIGNSTVASFIALILAKRNNKVLLVDNQMGDSAYLTVFKDKFDFGLTGIQRDNQTSENKLVKSWIPTLDVFLPVRSRWYSESTVKSMIFDLDSMSITNRYDYLVIDAHSSANLFSNELNTNPSHHAISTIFQPYLQNANVFIPYEPFNSSLESIFSVRRNIENSSVVGNNIELKGIFINNFGLSRKKDLDIYSQQLDKIRDIEGDNLLNSVISNRKSEIRYFVQTSADILNKNLKIVSEYEKLVDEILTKF